MYECKHSIVEIYGLNKLPDEEVAEQVRWLLDKDRFICREDGREVLTSRTSFTVTMLPANIYQSCKRRFTAVEITEIIYRKYFASPKMRGNVDDTFFESINEVFICLVAAAIRHCLKQWSTGVYVEPPRALEFRYRNSGRKYSTDTFLRSDFRRNWSDEC